MDKSKDFRVGLDTLGLGMGGISRVTGHNMTGMGLDQSTVLFALWHDS